MSSEELELKWRSLIHKGGNQYTSLIINSVCVPEMYIALDIRGNRFLILQVPEDTNIECFPVKKENLSLEWHEETRFIIIGLLNKQFADLFNDLTISLYNRIKYLSDASKYSFEFISSFNKWSDFFENKASSQLSETELKGLFGELIFLNWLLIKNEDQSCDEVLRSWQGPFGRPQDFILSKINIEVKTKDPEDINIKISSEFQLEPELSKSLHLAIVNVLKDETGITITQLINRIRILILQKAADISIFLKTVSKAGININDATKYDSYKWNPVEIILYDCILEGFPKIVSSQLQPEVSRVRYNLNVAELNRYIIQNVQL